MSGPADIYLSPGVSIGLNHPCLIVAEIGQNHQGDVNIAEKLITTAKDCGVDVVKFQMSCLEEKFTKSALAREYFGPNSWGKTYGEHKRHLEFTKEQYMRLKDFAIDKDILFTASAMDTVSLDFLNLLEPPFIKIGSGDNSNVLLLEKAVSLNRPLVISTGMLDMKGVRKIYKICRDKSRTVLLHCVSSYPTLPSSVNLNVLDAFKQEFPDFHYGYSGHEEGIAISIAAVAKGARVLERHITLDKSWKGTDHSCSLEPNELANLITSIREVETSFGSKIKKFNDCELPCYQKLGKTLVAGKDMKKGTKLDENNVKIKVSNEKGLNPFELYEVMGQCITKDLFEDDPITNEDIEFFI